MQLIVFGIEQMDLSVRRTEAPDLLLQGNDRTLAPQHPCTPAPVGGAFGPDTAFFARDNLRRILDPANDTVLDLFSNIVDGDRSIGIAETATYRRALRSTLKFFEVFEVFVVRFKNQTAKTSKTSKKQKTNESAFVLNLMAGLKSRSFLIR
jgi:hypothetical protein